MLGVSSKYRKYPNYDLYRKIIENLWGETFSEPITPSYDNLKRRLIHL